MTAAAKTVHERMVAILAELPPIGKDQKNAQQGFMFRGFDDMLNALNPLMAKHGVFVVPNVLERETSQRTTSKGSVMFEVSLHVQFVFWGAAGDSVTASSWGEGTDMGDKATSKAMTMAFKSTLNQAFAISNKEFADPDALTAEETSRSSPQPKAAPAPNPGAATTPLLDEFRSLANALHKIQPEFDVPAALKAVEGKDDAFVVRASTRLQERIEQATKAAEVAERFPIPEGAAA